MDDNRIGEQAAKVGDDAERAIETVKGTITDVAGKAQTAAGEAGGTVRDAAIETAKQVGDAATTTYRQGVRAGDYVSRNSAEQPLLALLIAGAIGSRQSAHFSSSSSSSLGDDRSSSPLRHCSQGGAMSETGKAFEDRTSSCAELPVFDGANVRVGHLLVVGF
jgi:hypothetical protein